MLSTAARVHLLQCNTSYQAWFCSSVLTSLASSHYLSFQPHCSQLPWVLVLAIPLLQCSPLTPAGSSPPTSFTSYVPPCSGGLLTSVTASPNTPWLPIPSASTILIFCLFICLLTPKYNVSPMRAGNVVCLMLHHYLLEELPEHRRHLVIFVPHLPQVSPSRCAAGCPSRSFPGDAKCGLVYLRPDCPPAELRACGSPAALLQGCSFPLPPGRGPQGPPGPTHWANPSSSLREPQGQPGRCWRGKQGSVGDCRSGQGVVNYRACPSMWCAGGACPERWACWDCRAAWSGGAQGMLGLSSGLEWWHVGHAGSGAKSAVRQRANCARGVPTEVRTDGEHLTREPEKEQGRPLQVLPHTPQLLPRRGPHISCGRREASAWKAFLFVFRSVFCGLSWLLLGADGRSREGARPWDRTWWGNGVETPGVAEGREKHSSPKARSLFLSGRAWGAERKETSLWDVLSLFSQQAPRRRK